MAKNKPREPKPLGIPPETVDQRLRDLAQLYKLGVKLRDLRWIDRPGKPETGKA